jgi:hypothetical protein
VTYLNGQYPVLEVTKKDGATEELAIDKWRIDDIRDFLTSSLEAPTLATEL